MDRSSTSPGDRSAGPTDPALVAGLTALAEAVAGALPETRLGPGGRRPAVLWDRADATVVRFGPVVVKAHPAATDPADLVARVRLAADPALDGVLLSPLPLGVHADIAGLTPWVARIRDRWVTAWPAGAPVDPDRPQLAPWPVAAALLARLHGVPPTVVAVPPTTGPTRVARAVTRLRALAPLAAAEPVLAAFDALPAELDGSPGRPRTLVHGDWHLGQLVRLAAAGPDGGWRLIDLDDSGLGDPVWDLARPASWYAVGLLSAGDWERFLGAYQEAGGPALRDATGAPVDPWRLLELPARALTVQSAAVAVAAASREGRALDEADLAFVHACTRMPRIT